MKPTILWFVTVPFTEESIRGDRHAGTGGWLIAAAAAICPDVQLHIASVHPYERRYIQGAQFNSHFIRPHGWRSKLLMGSIFNRPLTEGPILAQMRSIIEDVQPDLVHIHGTERSFIEVLPFARTLGLPVLVSWQGILSVISRYYAGGYDRAFLKRFWYDRGGRLQALVPKRLLPEFKLMQTRAVRERAYLPLASYIGGRTDWDRGLAKLLSPGCQYFHIDEFLRRPFYRNSWSTPECGDKFRVHTTLGNTLSKGLDIIAEAAVLLEGLAVPLEWTIAGAEDDSMIVKAARKKLGSRFPSKSLRFLGRLPADELISRMKEAHLYVMASFAENSPNNLAEAMILGMPCIATLAGGTGSYLRDRETGILIQPGDPFGLAAAMLELRDDPKNARAMGQRARQVALKRHDVDRIKQQVLHAYNSILKNTGP